MNILLVAGHGDGDFGAVSSHYKEADLTRRTVSALCRLLSPFCLTTIFDTNLDMYKYLKTHNYNFKNYNYVLEVHFNAGAANPTGNGVTTGSEIIIQKGTYQKAVDKKILSNLQSIGFKNRGVKERTDLQNPKKVTSQNVPYSLLEVCFIDDLDDLKLFNNNFNQVVQSIANAIISSFNLQIQELTSINDIVWELNNQGIISNKDLWLKKLEIDTDSYWLARKVANRLRKE